jgi:hypothetical protein
MGLLDIFKEKKEKTPLEEIKDAFRFLTSEYGFQLTLTETRRDLKAENVLVYRNDKSNLQLEICGNETWFHCEIRRLLNGQPAKYSDEDNCIGFESLAVLESDNNYEHLDYFAGGKTGLNGVLKNTSRLFRRHKAFLTTDQWIDVNRLECLRHPDAIKLDSQFAFFALLRKRATKLLSENGYALLMDRDELPPFDSDGMVFFLTFGKDDRKIKIAQVDWRDSYYIYRIEVSNKKVAEINILDLERHEGVEKILQEIIRQLKLNNNKG